MISALVLGLIVLIPDASAAEPQANVWSRVAIPAEGDAGGWALAGGSDVRHLTASDDGTLYAYANPAGSAYTLFKSMDGGRSWSHIGGVTDTIVDIAVTPGDPARIY